MLHNNISFTGMNQYSQPEYKKQAVHFRALENSPDKDCVTISQPDIKPVEHKNFITYIKEFADKQLRNRKLIVKEQEFYKKLKSEKINNDEQRFGNSDIKTLLKLYRKNPEFVELCVNERDSDYKNPRFYACEIETLTKLAQQEPNIVKSAIEKRNYINMPEYDTADIRNIVEFSKKIPEDKMLALINDKTTVFRMREYADDKNFDKIYGLLKEGILLTKRYKYTSYDEFYQREMELIKTTPNSMRDLLNSPDFHDKLKQNSAGKYQNELLEVLGNMNFSMKRQLLDSGLSGEDFLKVTQKLSKSTFKLAYETPNQYLGNLDTEFTKPQDGKLPELSKETLAAQRKCIISFFQDNIGQISRALKYLDTDTMAHLMDKRTEIFRESLDDLDELSDKNYELLSQLIKCKSKATGKNLSPKEKIELCHIVESFQKAELKTGILKQAAKTGSIDINATKNMITNKVLSLAGINPNDKTIPKSKKNFNQEFSYLLLCQSKEKDESQLNTLYTVIKQSVKGDFNKFINNPSNQYGVANSITKSSFKDNGLNYDKWMKPDIEESFKLQDKNMTIKLWDRNPQEDLFVGNKTTCCTAIGTGTNEEATPIYLLHTAFNVAELYDDKNNVVGMSRAFMANIDDEPALIMDNIELNNTFTKGLNKSEKIKLRNKFFDYMKKYSEQVGGKGTPVYFYSGDINVPDDGLEMVDATADFIGSTYNSEVYMNSAGIICIAPEDLKDEGDIRWYKVM